MIKMRFNLLLLFTLTFQFVFSQTTENIVTLTTSGTGKTLEEAKNNALRSAIEQAFGAFISSKTEILNDQLVSDQITSVSSGNIQKFEIKSESKLPNDIWCTTLTATVSVDKLISFVQDKGVTVEIKGGLFALNVKQQILNEKAEIEIITQAIGNAHDIFQKSFDYSIEAGEPIQTQGDNNKWSIPLNVMVYVNENFNSSTNYIIKSLEAISMKENEILDYTSHGKPIFKVWIKSNGESKIFVLRKKESIQALQSLSYNLSNHYTKQFKVSWGTSQSFIGEQFTYSINQSNEEQWHYKLNPQEKNGKFLGLGYQNLDEKQIYVTLDLPNTKSLIDKFSLKHKLTLAELESLTAYKVEPMKSLSYYKYGGYVFAESSNYQVKVKMVDNSNVIQEVFKEGPAYNSGLRNGDVILSINGEKFTKTNIAKLILLSKESLKTSIFEISRGDSILKFTVVPIKAKVIYVAAPLTYEAETPQIANDFAQELIIGGYNDWILPPSELMKLLRQSIGGNGVLNVPSQIFVKNLIGKLKPSQFYNNGSYGDEFFWCREVNSTSQTFSILKVTPQSEQSNFEILDPNIQRSFQKGYFIPVRIQYEE